MSLTRRSVAQDREADNYNDRATVPDDSCAFSGCTERSAPNFDERNTKDDGSCDLGEQAALLEGFVRNPNTTSAWTRLRGWDQETQPCQGTKWEGVSCSYGHVVLVDLESSHIHSYGELGLELHWEKLRALGTQQSGVQLHLSNTGLSGTLPDLGQMNIFDLRASNTKLSGTLPNDLGRLTKLWLHGTLLSGSLPAMVNASLTSLDLSDCRFSALPPSLPSRITHLSLKDNPIEATPEALAELTDAQRVPSLHKLDVGLSNVGVSLRHWGFPNGNPSNLCNPGMFCQGTRVDTPVGCHVGGTGCAFTLILFDFDDEPLRSGNWVHGLTLRFNCDEKGVCERSSPMKDNLDGTFTAEVPKEWVDDDEQAGEPLLFHFFHHDEEFMPMMTKGNEMASGRDCKEEGDECLALRKINFLERVLECHDTHYDPTQIGVLVCFDGAFNQTQLEVAKASRGCQQCPKCGICENGTLNAVREGYTVPNLTHTPHSTAAFRCGGSDTRSTHLTCLETEAPAFAPKCSANFTGKLCRSCAEGYHRVLAECSKCPEDDGLRHAWQAAFVVFALIVVIATPAMQRFRKVDDMSEELREVFALSQSHSELQSPLNPEGSAEPKVDEPSGSGLGSALFDLWNVSFQPLRVMITYFQVTSLVMPSMSDYTDSVPKDSAWLVDLVTHPWSRFLFDLECDTDHDDFASKYWLEVVVVPVTMLVVLVVVPAALACRSRDKARGEIKERGFFVVFFVFPSVCKDAFSALTCRSIGPDSSVLVNDDRVLCEDPSHQGLQWFSRLVILWGLFDLVYFGGWMWIKARRYENEFTDQKESKARQLATRMKVDVDTARFVLRDVDDEFGQDFSFL